jgi:hypothetical protein
MRWLSYIPGHSTLVLLDKAARARLMVTSPDVGALPDERIASVTEEMNQISDDILDAKNIGLPPARVAAAIPVREPIDPDVALPTTVAASAALKSTNSKGAR